MAMSWVQVSVFTAALAFGGAAALWWVLERRGEPQPTAADAPVASEVAALAGSVGERPAQGCGFDPLIRPTGAGDGQRQLPALDAGVEPGTISSWIRSGKETAAGGRMRDAELAFLGACRAAEQMEDPARVAEAKYQLARHYSHVARSAEGLPDDRREDLLERSERLYGDSLLAFRRLYGDTHDSTRFAALGLERVRTALTGAMPALEAAPPSRATATGGAVAVP